MGRFWIYWTYHKDSYMAHRRDWKTGYEGRYRRTHSPSASDRIMSNLKSPNSIITTSPNSKSSALQNINSNGNLRPALSTSSLMHRATSPLDNENNNNNLPSENGLNNNNEIFSVNRNDDWTPHYRQKSTTVNFTADELRAFKARKMVKNSSAPSPANNNGVGDMVSSPARPPALTRAVSLGDALHNHHHCEPAAESSPAKNCRPCLGLDNGEPNNCRPRLGLDDCEPNNRRPRDEENTTATSSPDVSINSAHQSPVSSPSRLSHDGPITAHPATVTEEFTSPGGSPSSGSGSVHSSPASSFYNNQPSSLVSSVSTPNISSLVFRDTTAYHRSLSGTCPSMTSDFRQDDENIVVLGYGRTLDNDDEISCNERVREFVQQNNIDNKLHTLLAVDSGYKSAATYMEGIFALEFRLDLLCPSHSQHPDLKRILSQSSVVHESTNKAPLSADSTYFTMSESKAKLLSTFREKQQIFSADSKHLEAKSLADKKEKLIGSITKKLEFLREEQNAIKDEIIANAELGACVSCKVEKLSKGPELAKYKLHVEEMDKITSLLLGLSGRLARVDNALMLSPEDQKTLAAKKEKLEDQLEEAKKLKENIDKRAVQVARNVAKYLTCAAEYADYDHFIKMKAKLLMDAKEINDKIILGQEQLEALNNPPSLSRA